MVDLPGRFPGRAAQERELVFTSAALDAPRFSEKLHTIPNICYVSAEHQVQYQGPRGGKGGGAGVGARIATYVRH